ncbi:MAG: primosomal protein N' [Lachnospiraceae bacterium]|nr:primosomal protein N' [Lachnospiraceae bacterium]
MNRYADVIVEISHEKLDRTFQYRIPEELEEKVKLGSRVLAPFGKGDRQITGYVVGITDRPAIEEDKVKDITKVTFSEGSERSVDTLLELAAWMKERYGGTMINALRCVLPIKAAVRKTKTKSDFVLEDSGAEKPELSPAQRDIINAFRASYESGDRTPVLIFGVTGSGKTEVYIDIIEEVVKSGKQAIMLIPEIALTYQTAKRFYDRFGDRVSYLHSRLSKGERYDRFMKAKNGEIDVMIGPRSALFTPFPDPGIVVMDEEHDTSYLSESMPKYNTRETAEKLCSLTGAAFIMGSATPSVDAFSATETGRYRLFRLPDRVSGQLPQVKIVDLRQELKNGNRSMFSEELQSLIADRLQKKEQIMLFLNRRGYAGFVSCRKCGFVYKCPHCDVSLIHHRNGKLVCHYCGYSEEIKKTCPQCGSKYIGGMRAGTEQVESRLASMFPGVRILRMDMDTTRKKGDYERILKSFSEKKADILIGTQMIVKGHDFADVTLVGILAADLSLHISDFRAGERTFELLTQAAGRAGRAKDNGLVIIQTYDPENPAVALAAAQDYEGFYREEKPYRELCGYPPFMHMMTVTVLDEDRDAASVFIEKAASSAKKREVLVVGPSDAVISKIKDVYRKCFFVKSPDHGKLISIKDEIEKIRNGDEVFRGRVEFDFD